MLSSDLGVRIEVATDQVKGVKSGTEAAGEFASPRSADFSRLNSPLCRGMGNLADPWSGKSLILNSAVDLTAKNVKNAKKAGYEWMAYVFPAPGR